MIIASALITNGTAMNKPKQRQGTVYLERINPEEDGKKHINIHHKGKDPLGRMLSHYYSAPFVHPFFGPFETIEGFWHYLKDGCRDDVFRNLNGHKSKQRFRKKNEDGEYLNLTIPRVAEVMLAANYAKIEQNPEILTALVQSTLPFEQYFLQDESNLPIRPRGSEWLVKVFRDLRKHFQEGTKPEEIAYKEVFKDFLPKEQHH